MYCQSRDLTSGNSLVFWKTQRVNHFNVDLRVYKVLIQVDIEVVHSLGFPKYKQPTVRQGSRLTTSPTLRQEEESSVLSSSTHFYQYMKYLDSLEAAVAAERMIAAMAKWAAAAAMELVAVAAAVCAAAVELVAVAEWAITQPLPQPRDYQVILQMRPSRMQLFSKTKIDRSRILTHRLLNGRRRITLQPQPLTSPLQQAQPPTPPQLQPQDYQNISYICTKGGSDSSGYCSRGRETLLFDEVDIEVVHSLGFPKHKQLTARQASRLTVPPPTLRQEEESSVLSSSTHFYQSHPKRIICMKYFDSLGTAAAAERVAAVVCAAAVELVAAAVCADVAKQTRT
ncbi:hypothetical protein TIFTF001_021481 [Ficus carica]|uniref:Uncharacterized protein n=1 Tax=Ficus carica TaxID=3494 RepID=A0AA88AG13_FICCA|nr:hypothetical protein TIFTF001_021481 [Ficus carica]